MQLKPSQVPDILRCVVAVASRVTDDDWLHWRALREAMGALKDASANTNPADALFEAIMAAGRVFGGTDPFAPDRERMVKDALALEDEARKLLAREADPLLAALRLAALANRMDAGLRASYGAREVLRDFPGSELAQTDESDFLADLKRAASVVYILDGAGESVFDKLLIEQLAPGRAVTAVVARSPVLLSATAQDLAEAGFPAWVKVMDPGADGLGCPLDRVSREFREVLDRADLVLAKGECAFQTLHGSARNAYFLLACRSPELAAHLGLKPGSLALVRE